MAGVADGAAKLMMMRSPKTTARGADRRERERGRMREEEMMTVVVVG